MLMGRGGEGSGQFDCSVDLLGIMSVQTSSLEGYSRHCLNRHFLFLLSFISFLCLFM